jgi:DNA (cytosine-5)-methyltransferase 1
MTILNLFAGIGGNRKKWGDTHQITAIEYDPKIAAIYKDFYPNDTVLVEDAHEYLLHHYQEYDFIWSSPPCPTHSQTNNFLHAQGHKRYPDMRLWQEIIYLMTYCKGKFCVENVKSYYEPLIKPQVSGRHYFWANFTIPLFEAEPIGKMGALKENDIAKGRHKLQALGMPDLSKYDYYQKEKLLRNCVSPDIGLAILESVQGIYDSNKVNQIGLFAK